MVDETLQAELSDELDAVEDDAMDAVADLAFPPGPTVV
jgi:hypothetical protein